MARIRTIKPEFWSDEKLAPLPSNVRLVFLGLWSMADDMGRLLDNLKVIDAFIYPATDETAREAIETIEDLGRIRRGKTSSGQAVIQIVNWHHQKIDKPNFATCLPQIAGDPEDAVSHYRRHKRIPDRTKAEVWRRDRATCQLCGREDLRREKRDRYDAGDDLGEIDHRIEAADGGESSIENLQLLCLPCNRKKAGENVTRRNAEASGNDRRLVDDGSATRSTTGDQHTDDRGPATDPRSELALHVVGYWNAKVGSVGAAAVTAVKGRRSSALSARVKESGWVENAKKAIDYLVADRWYKANPDAIRFDVLLRPGKVEEYLEKASVPRSSTNGSRNGARSAVDASHAEKLKKNPKLGTISDE